MSAAFLSRTSTDGILTVRASVGGPPTASLLIDTDPARDTPADAGLTLLAMKVLLLATGWMWVGLVIALGLLALKCWSMARLMRIGLPVPGPVPTHVG